MDERAHANKSVGTRSAFRLQFITTPTSDTPGTSILLHFDNKRYIFGEITEGTQRACIQRGIGLKKVRGLFLTGKTAWNNGGLIGMILSLADTQSSETESEDSSRRPRLHIYAGPKQLHSLACARRFIFRTGMPLSVHEARTSNGKVTQQPILEDENIRVWAVATRHRTSRPPSAVFQADSDLSDAEAEPFQDDEIEESRVTFEQDIRTQVVNNMFDSDWHRDRLSEHKVKDIKLPAVVWVRDPETKALKNYTLYDNEKIAPFTPDSVVLIRDPWPASMVQELPNPSNLPNRTAMSYIVKGYPQRGKFDPVKAKALGVKPGPVFSRLVAGMSVTLEDGSVITSEMVMSPSRPGRGFAVFDIPSPAYLSDLNRQLDKQSELLEGVELVIWLTRDHVPLTPEFQKLMDKLKDKQHILSHPDICNDYISQDSSAKAAVRLSNISPELFSLPRFSNNTSYSPLPPTSTTALRNLLRPSEKGPQVIPAHRGLLAHIEPTFRLDSTEVPTNLDHSALKWTLEPEVRDLIPAGILADPRLTALPQLNEPEIITLGTGSAAPSKYRNVSAVLLRMPNTMGNYLFDCGEGTLGQLKRLFDAEQLDNLLCSLKVVWISHLHADHHLGTITLLQAIYLAGQRQFLRGGPRPSPPCLISEINMRDYIEDYKSILSVPDNALCRSIVCHWKDGLSSHDQPFSFDETDIPIRKLETAKVNHCHGAQAISITFDNGFKFSYSGDCRPSRYFCKIGADSDVLVHEATFDDGMEGDALAKKHSTTGEAVGVALEMKAKNLILTHFSQRYSKIPVLSSVKLPHSASEEEILEVEDAEIDSGYTGTTTVRQQPLVVPSQDDARAWSESSLTYELPVAIAFDLMRIRVSQIALMKSIFPAISKMFELDEEKLEQERQERIVEMTAKGIYKVKAASEQPSGYKNQPSKAGERKKKQQQEQQGAKQEGKKRKDISAGSNGHLEEARKDPSPGETVGVLVAEAGEITGFSMPTSDKDAKRAQAVDNGNSKAAVSDAFGPPQQQLSSADASHIHPNTQVPEIENMTLSPAKRRKIGDMA
ncbi:uncharacterized protein A1O9_06735 [Exophiala aquamarina CBS 119918]|uniref:ribonuclease Z n=1 Tax=Exophiala aquamarina CBS 119918 TaxID=1182545 RepID=A0A072P9V2_9EURO|nr:uncharacterized protein A1O9_06735 [Exophiala aquamarina CBS 119918]KEF56547.1 hypothetical protein A1O9_06735 [Exophiala aquamarina CBS 119918]